MRILIIANNDIGLYRFRAALISELVGRGHEVIASCPDGVYTARIEALGCVTYNIGVERRGKNPLKDAALFSAYRRLIKKVRPDLVITYTIKPNIYGALAARLAGVRYAANITGLGTVFSKGGALKTLVVKMYRAALKKADAVFFENAGDARIFGDERIAAPENYCVLGGAGVDTDEYPALPYPDNGGKVRFLFMGRIMREKGVDELFEAAARLKRENADVEVEMLGFFEENEENYKSEVGELEKQGVVDYAGFVCDVRPYIERCDCFVLPSYHEGMANTLLECASSGRPLIATRIHGCMEAVEDGKNGFLCEPGDAAGLYGCMKHFASLTRDERAEMGGRSRAIAVERFDRKQIVKKTCARLFGDDDKQKRRTERVPASQNTAL